MKMVADKLAEWAKSQPDDDRADAFGRSAFNRYYYSLFLITRDMLKTLNAKWANTNHSAIPGLIEGEVIKAIRRHLDRSTKAGLLPRNEAWIHRKKANSSVSELSNILRIAYSIRIVADYEPDQKIFREERNVIRLAGETLDGAQNWQRRVELCTKGIISVWRQLGI